MRTRTVSPVSPGEMLEEEFLKPLGLTKYRLAKDIGVPAQRIGAIVAGKRAITADTARALGDIARAKGMTQVARDAGLSRESLYKALGENGNPSFATVLKVARAIGVKFHAEAA